MAHRASNILPFINPAEQKTGVVGRVHHDGSITFRGQHYPTIKDVPKDCQAIRPDVETESSGGASTGRSLRRPGAGAERVVLLCLLTYIQILYRIGT